MWPRVIFIIIIFPLCIQSTVTLLHGCGNSCIYYCVTILSFTFKFKMARRQKKTTRFEYQELLAFVECNKVLLRGKTKPLEAQNVKRLWQSFSNKMASLAVGPMKSADRWRKVFIEWKVNVKRKSRLIHEEIGGTGGEPRVTKPLNDVEERLLNLMSKAHLGDSSLPDNLGHAEGVYEAEVEQFIDTKNFAEPFQLLIETGGDKEVPDMSPAGQSSDDAVLSAIPRTAEKTPCRTPQSSKPGLSTNAILRDACNSLKNTNNEVLAEAFNQFTEVFKIKAEADMLRAEAEMVKAKAKMAKAKCLHFQTFGNLDDFEEII